MAFLDNPRPYGKLRKPGQVTGLDRFLYFHVIWSCWQDSLVFLGVQMLDDFSRYAKGLGLMGYQGVQIAG